MSKKQLYTFLAKIQSVLSNGSYGELMITDYRGVKFKACRASIDDTTIKYIRSRWTFIRVELRGDRFYFNKAVECDREIAQLMIDEHRRSEWEKGREKKQLCAE